MPKSTSVSPALFYVLSGDKSKDSKTDDTAQTGVPVRYYSKRYNKLLLPASAKAIYGSYCRAESAIYNLVYHEKE